MPTGTGSIAVSFGPDPAWGRSARTMLLLLGAAALIPLAAAPTQARSDSRSPSAVVAADVRDEIARRAPSDLRDFYAARDHAPLWLDTNGVPLPAARQLLEQIETARIDGLKPGKLKARSLAKALDRAAAAPVPETLARAELELSKRYAAYVKALRKTPPRAMIYESAALAPVVPTTGAALQAAAGAPSLDRHVAAMGWMHPLYAPLRQALLAPARSEEQRRSLAASLARVRALPANPGQRYVLIDAAGARLWMYENGKPAGTMRVVVGKADNQTPLMAGFLRFAIVNPYWNVPEDLVQIRIAGNVLTKGTGYLRGGGYQVLSDWSERPAVIDPARIDWQAVAARKQAPPRVRQLPGKGNFMGRVKFMFPNDLGIYLHDTPDRHLLLEDVRQHSSGCVRLENAGKLGRWLLGKPLPTALREPEQRIELPEVVPVYITYLTAMPENAGTQKSRIAFRSDVYSLDSPGNEAPDKPRLARSP